MSKYLLHGKLTAKEGLVDDLESILKEASSLVRKSAKGCKIYIVSRENNNLNDVFITEVWDSKEDHDNSLKIDEVRNLIMKAIPLIDGQPTKGQEFEIVGGLDV